VDIDNAARVPGPGDIPKIKVAIDKEIRVVKSTARH
jgi:hypothetical protein